MGTKDNPMKTKTYTVSVRRTSINKFEKKKINRRYRTSIQK